MPGSLFGSGPALSAAAERVQGEFERIWGAIDVLHSSVGSRLGAHGYNGPSCCIGAQGGLHAWDGMHAWVPRTDAKPADAPSAGNHAWIGTDGTIILWCDESGVFPLYYAEQGGDLVFSSLLRPLARALDATPDVVGVESMMRFAYTCAGRTVFQGVRRLLPGQKLIREPGKTPRIQETSRLWVGLDDRFDSAESVAEEMAPLLRTEVGRALDGAESAVLMMSAGWDSRTILEAIRDSRYSGQLIGYSHGDPQSRELRITGKIARASEVSWSARPIDEQVWSLDHLAVTFERTENLLFPHWSWAGRVNADHPTLLSGVLGEVIGGHYGTTWLAEGASKVGAVLRGLRPGSSRDAEVSLESAREAFRLGSLRRPWYLREGVHADPGEVREALNADIQEDIERLLKGG